jgi:hypothetical protein
MISESGIPDKSKPRPRHAVDRLARAAAPRRRRAARVHRTARARAMATTPPMDPRAYHGGNPGGPFVKNNPGRRRGAVDRTPRARRFRKQLIAKMHTGVVRFDVRPQRYVLFNPATDEPLTGPDGNWIYDPTYGQVAAVAMLYGALYPNNTANSPRIG